MRRDRVLLAGGAVFGAAIVAYGLVGALGILHWTRMSDLLVYRWGGANARHTSDLYELLFNHKLQFTYTPFAAAVFIPVASIPLGVAKVVVTAATLVALGGSVWLTLGALGEERGAQRTGLALLVSGVALWLEPVRQTIGFGQVNVLLMFLVLADLYRPDSRRSKGLGVGVAAGFKLSPAIFIPYLLLTRRIRAAATATAAFAATVVLGAVVLPHESHRFWIDRLFSDPRRTGDVAYVANQSIDGVLVRLRGTVDLARSPWVALAAITVVAGLAVAAVLGRRGREVEGILVAALTGLLVSPVSWSHHWVYLAPLLALLAHRAVVERSRSAALLAGGLVVLFSGVIWLAPSKEDRELHWTGLQLLVGNLYVVAGVVALAAMTVQVSRLARADN